MFAAAQLLKKRYKNEILTSDQINESSSQKTALACL